MEPQLEIVISPVRSLGAGPFGDWRSLDFNPFGQGLSGNGRLDFKDTVLVFSDDFSRVYAPGSTMDRSKRP